TLNYDRTALVERAALFSSWTGGNYIASLKYETEPSASACLLGACFSEQRFSGDERRERDPAYAVQAKLYGSLGSIAKPSDGERKTPTRQSDFTRKGAVVGSYPNMITERNALTVDD